MNRIFYLALYSIKYDTPYLNTATVFDYAYLVNDVACRILTNALGKLEIWRRDPLCFA